MENTCPEFFKVFYGPNCSEQQRIPPDFKRHITAPVPNNCVLKNIAGRTWNAELNDVDGQVYIARGWDKFARDNNLALGDFLIFAYGPPLVFTIKHFGKNGCIKKPVPVRPTKPITTPIKVEPSTSTSPTPSAFHNHSLIQPNECPTQGCNGTVFLPLSGNPHFHIKISAYEYSQGVPPSFSSFFPRVRIPATLLYMGSQWDLSYNGCGHSPKFGGGWVWFRRDVGLKKGDSCTFELTAQNSERLTFEISIPHGRTPGVTSA